jgi:hypothetical protein
MNFLSLWWSGGPRLGCGGQRDDKDLASMSHPKHISWVSHPAILLEMYEIFSDALTLDLTFSQDSAHFLAGFSNFLALSSDTQIEPVDSV